jgi:uncharacterized membrane protein
MAVSASRSTVQSVIARIGENNIFAVVWASYVFFAEFIFAPLIGFALLLLLRRYLYGGSYPSQYIYATRTFWLGVLVFGIPMGYLLYMTTHPSPSIAQSPSEIFLESMQPKPLLVLLIGISVLGLIPWYYRSIRGLINALRGNGIYPEPRPLILGLF